MIKWVSQYLEGKRSLIKGRGRSGLQNATGQVLPLQKGGGGGKRFQPF